MGVSSVHKLVKFCVVHDETHAYPIWLGNEERWADPFGGYVHFGDDIFVDEVLDNAVRLPLVSEGNAARDDLLMGCRVLIHTDVHVPVWCAHRNGREQITQRFLIFLK